jgi:hypothetical protein
LIISGYRLAKYIEMSGRRPVIRWGQGPFDA